MPEARAYQRILVLIGFDGLDERTAERAMLLARMNHPQRGKLIASLLGLLGRQTGTAGI